MTAVPLTGSSSCCAPAAAGKTCPKSMGTTLLAGGGSDAGKGRECGTGSGGPFLRPWMREASWSGPKLSWMVALSPQKGGPWCRAYPTGKRHQMDAGYGRHGAARGVLLGQCSTGRGEVGRTHPGYHPSAARRHGRPRKRPKSLVADRGYDSRKFRRAMRSRGIRPCIPPRRYQGKRRPGRPLGEHREAYAQRWVVERTFAWLGNFRRLVVRYEHRLSVYQAFFTIACILMRYILFIT